MNVLTSTYNIGADDLGYFVKLLKKLGGEQIPMIGFVHPRVEKIDNESVVLLLPLEDQNKNHLGSMYLGALTIGAELSVGLIAYYLAIKNGANVLLAFKSMESSFLYRAESDVYFEFRDMSSMKKFVYNVCLSEERVSQSFETVAYVIEGNKSKVEVANFTLELSLRKV